MAGAGIRQFLDLGTGLPTSPNVHEIAGEIHRDAAVVYVDNDPTVAVHSRALLAGYPGVVALDGDLRDPADIPGAPEVQCAFDLRRPVGLLFVAVLHFVEVADAPGIVSRYLRDLPAGSAVAISAASREGVRPELVHRIQRVYAGANCNFVFRTRAEVQALFGELTLLPPGVSDVYDWSTRRPREVPAIRELAGIAVQT